MTGSSALWRELIPGVAVTIIKINSKPDKPPYSYPARVIPSDHPGWIAFEAFWALPDMDVDGITYETGGRIVEYFSPNRWSNIFHVFGRDGASAGLYANVTAPADLRLSKDGALVLSWLDYWLDVIKLPSGEVRVLDEDEFEASGIQTNNPRLGKRIIRECENLQVLLKSPEWRL